MKLGYLIILTGLSVTVNLASCAQEPTVQQPLPSSTAKPQVSPSVSQAPQSQAPPASQNSVLRSGSFVSGEHPTTGTIRIVKQNNQRQLELDAAFNTSTSGPDLFVILHRSPDVIGSTQPPAFSIKEGDYVLLAPLKNYSGAQTYPIPDNLDLEQFKSVAIWCRQFNATFGSARLQTQ